MLGKWTLNRKKIENQKTGYAVTVNVPMYRSLALSMIEDVELSIDRKRVNNELICLEHRGTEYPVHELGSSSLMDIYWDFTEECRLIVKDKPLETGEHEVVLTFKARLPYLIPSDGEERANHMSEACREILEIKEQEAR